MTAGACAVFGVDPCSGAADVHDVSKATSIAVAARVHDQPRFGLQSREIITTTLPGLANVALIRWTSRRKCDKTALFVLTRPRPSSYLALALIGVNRGRGAGKGR